MNCPRCTNVSLNMSERAGVEIDYCPSCRGVWLDRGELDKILERSASPQFSNGGHEEVGDRREDFHHDRHGHYGGQRGRRSWLREIFD